MATWILVPSLVSLRTEFNRLAPARKKDSDGSIGNPDHARRSSDHNPDETGVTPTEDADAINEVHALDVDKDLEKPGWTMEKAVQIIVGRHRSNQDNRLQNVIYNRRIWSESWGWTQHAYDGDNPHDQHAHFGCKYTNAAESGTGPWGLLMAEVTTEYMESLVETRLNQMVPGLVTKAVRALIPEFNTALMNRPVWGGEGAPTLGVVQQRVYNSTFGGGLTTAVLSGLANVDTVDEQAIANALADAMLPALVAAVQDELGEVDGSDPAAVSASVEAALEKVRFTLDDAPANG